MKLRIGRNGISVSTAGPPSQTSSRLEKLSSRLPSNRVSDDAAGLTIGEKPCRQARRLPHAIFIGMSQGLRSAISTMGKDVPLLPRSQGKLEQGMGV